MRTSQEIFDIVCQHLLTQKVKSIENFHCLYRGPNGTKCAVGCLIPDDQYKEDMEHNSITLLLRVKEFLSLELKKELSTNITLLKSLQNIHDKYSVFEWKSRLQLLADDSNLQFNYR